MAGDRGETLTEETEAEEKEDTDTDEVGKEHETYKDGKDHGRCCAKEWVRLTRRLLSLPSHGRVVSSEHINAILGAQHWLAQWHLTPDPGLGDRSSLAHA